MLEFKPLIFGDLSVIIVCISCPIYREGLMEGFSFKFKQLTGCGHGVVESKKILNRVNRMNKVAWSRKNGRYVQEGQVSQATSTTVDKYG